MQNVLKHYVIPIYRSILLIYSVESTTGSMTFKRYRSPENKWEKPLPASAVTFVWFIELASWNRAPLRKQQSYFVKKYLSGVEPDASLLYIQDPPEIISWANWFQSTISWNTDSSPEYMQNLSVCKMVCSLRFLCKIFYAFPQLSDCIYITWSWYHASHYLLSSRKSHHLYVHCFTCCPISIL